MAKIKDITAREILDSRGTPTIETTVLLNDGSLGTASVPSGLSVSKYEAVELRDHDITRFKGLGVQQAITNVTTIIKPKLVGMEANRQQDIDRAMIELDGTFNKSRLGANTTLSVSMATTKAAAKSSVLPLYLYIREFIQKEGLTLKVPTPVFDMINGGLHGNNNIDFQGFLLIPATFKSYSEALHLGVTVHKNLKEVLLRNNMIALLGDEGGYAPLLASNEDAFFLLSQAVNEANLRLGYDVFFGLDAAASQLYKDQKYKIRDQSMALSGEELTNFYDELIKKYRIIYLEDPLSEDDWNGWVHTYQNTSRETVIIGDDLTATNPYRLQMALDKKTIGGIVIKPNQIGTVIEALAVVEVARHAALKVIVSNRSGETNDDFIADFAVAVSADYMKFGAPARGERVEKYNRLLEIEKQLKII